MNVETMAEIIGRTCHTFEDALIELAKEHGEALTAEEAEEIVNDFLTGEAEDGEKMFEMFRSCLKVVIRGEILQSGVRADCRQGVESGLNKIFSNPFVTNAILRFSVKSKNGFDIGLMWEVDYINSYVPDEIYTDITFPLVEMSIVKWDENNEIVPIQKIVTSEVTDSIFVPLTGTAQVGISYKVLTCEFDANE